jgi:DNA (cytosine-5)-methyltransferase 1
VIQKRFIDLFAGCGGLSLGLAQAGWKGAFAIERDPMAFETFSANFLEENSKARFDWPSWLEKRAWGIQDLLATHRRQLRALRGHVELVAGGPPCQGFSFAGRRKRHDPRNLLFKQYVDVVDAIQPPFLVLENVPGMRVVHGRSRLRASRRSLRRSFSDRLIESLEELGYEAKDEVLDAAEFGVPQRRPRLIVVGMRREFAERLPEGSKTMFHLLDIARTELLRELRLKTPVSAKEALADLEIDPRETRLQPCSDPASSPRFLEPIYHRRPVGAYQTLMRENGPQQPNSMRLARHSEVVAARFADIRQTCRAGVALGKADRERFGLLKQRTFPLADDQPAPTITTLPDDLLHYSEPRILTVRECARLQSFPDWFEFRGKFTTGGDRRVKECPRYTQVGNAVPPLLARAIGKALSAALNAGMSPSSQKAPPRKRTIRSRQLNLMD